MSSSWVSGRSQFWRRGRVRDCGNLATVEEKKDESAVDVDGAEDGEGQREEVVGKGGG